MPPKVPAILWNSVGHVSYQMSCNMPCQIFYITWNNLHSGKAKISEYLLISVTHQPRPTAYQKCQTPAPASTWQPLGAIAGNQMGMQYPMLCHLSCQMLNQMSSKRFYITWKVTWHPKTGPLSRHMRIPVDLSKPDWTQVHPVDLFVVLLRYNPELYAI